MIDLDDEKPQLTPTKIILECTTTIALVEMERKSQKIPKNEIKQKEHKIQFDFFF